MSDYLNQALSAKRGIRISGDLDKLLPLRRRLVYDREQDKKTYGDLIIRLRQNSLEIINGKKALSSIEELFDV